MTETKIIPFQVGERVHIDYVPKYMVGHPSNVNGTIAKVVGVTYGIDVDDDKYYAWYPHGCLTKIQESDMADQFPKEAHVRLHLAGTPAKIEQFHYTLAKLDPTWPYTPENGYTAEEHCGVCSGAIYRWPNINADGLRALAKQVDGSNRLAGGLKLKIKKFNVQARCSANEPDLDPEDEPVILPVAGPGLVGLTNPVPDVVSLEGMVD